MSLRTFALVELYGMSMLLGFITWDVDPVLLSLGGVYDLRYYSLLWALGLVLGYWLLLRFAKLEGTPTEVVDRVALYATLGVVVGARLGHCFFYDPVYYLSNPVEILQVWKGGLSSHGGALGVLLGMWLASRRERVPMLWILDRVVVPIALIASMIRLGNLMNSEIYGHETSLPWGMIFVRAGETVPRHPTQLYEAIPYLLVFVVLLWVFTRRAVVRARRGLVFSVFLVVMFSLRIVIEFVKEVQSDFESGWLLDMGQILSIPFLALGVVLLVWSLRRGPSASPVYRVYGRVRGRKVR